MLITPRHEIIAHKVGPSGKAADRRVVEQFCDVCLSTEAAAGHSLVRLRSYAQSGKICLRLPTKSLSTLSGWMEALPGWIERPEVGRLSECILSPFCDC